MGQTIFFLPSFPSLCLLATSIDELADGKVLLVGTFQLLYPNRVRHCIAFNGPSCIFFLNAIIQQILNISHEPWDAEINV